MKLVPCERVETRYHGNRSDILETIMDFKESEHECAKLEDFPHKNAKICATTFRHAIKYYKICGIKVTYRGDEVYFIKEDL